MAAASTGRPPAGDGGSCGVLGLGGVRTAQPRRPSNLRDGSSDSRVGSRSELGRHRVLGGSDGMVRVPREQADQTRRAGRGDGLVHRVGRPDSGRNLGTQSIYHGTESRTYGRESHGMVLCC